MEIIKPNNVIIEMANKKDANIALNRLSKLYEHMLKYQFVDRKYFNSNSWNSTINEENKYLSKLLSNKDVYNKFISNISGINKAYSLGLARAINGNKATSFPQSITPEYEVEKVIDRNYIISFLDKYAQSDSEKNFVKEIISERK